MKSHLNDKTTYCLPLCPQSRHSDLRYFSAVFAGDRHWMLYRGALFMNRLREAVCQCPLGLIPHFYSTTKNYALYIGVFQCPHGLELLRTANHRCRRKHKFQCPHGLELLRLIQKKMIIEKLFQCPHGLKLLLERAHAEMVELRFNALMGLSCYVWLSAELKTLKEFQCHHGLELLLLNFSHHFH